MVGVYKGCLVSKFFVGTAVWCKTCLAEKASDGGDGGGGVKDGGDGDGDGDGDAAAAAAADCK